jgi:diaminopimelate epimerase
MINLHYVHGSENHFFILDQNTLSNTLDQPELQSLAQKLCHNSYLPAADGLLVVDNAQAKDCLGKMTVINADGSIATMCGNGLRCVGSYLAHKFNQTQFKVETMQDHLSVRLLESPAPGVKWVGVQISPVRFNSASFPYTNLPFNQIINQKIPQFSDHLKFTAIAVPNPHLISFVQDKQDLETPLNKLGTYLNADNPFFPDGVNVSFAQILGPNKLFVRTFERGVGFTNACGTGMSATSMVFAINYPDLFNKYQPVTIYNPGGVVETYVHGNNQSSSMWIQLVGNATHVATLKVSEQQLQHADTLSDSLIFTGEEDAYQAFVKTVKNQPK